MKLLVYISLIMAIVILVGGFSYWRGINEPVSETGEDKIFAVEPGQGVKSIAAKLKAEGLIRSDSYFSWYIWQEGAESKLQAGEYLLNTGMNLKEIAASLVSGQVQQKEKTVKIIEGWKIGDIDEYLSASGFAGKGAFQKLAGSRLGDWTFAFERPDFLADAPDYASLEGYLFPDTYRVYEDAVPADIIKKALDNFGRKFDPSMRAEIASQGKTVFDIITLASIIEKEVRSKEDRKLVAGVLYKRMEIGMKLEVDATINYLTGKKNPGSLLEDLAIDSPYNTYKYYGLPPGPISNPGITAIDAAIYPQKSPYLFYLNRQDTGETIFSKTYKEHLANKAKYLR
jgi:UPF0755 protein